MSVFHPKGVIKTFHAPPYESSFTLKLDDYLRIIKIIIIIQES